MKNILICFLTSRDLLATSKIAEKYFSNFEIIMPKNIPSFTRNIQKPVNGIFVPVTIQESQLLVNSIISDIKLSILPVLVIDEEYPISAIPTQFENIFSIILSAKQGYESLATTLEIIGKGIINEEHLNESERKYNTLVNNLPGITYRCKNDSDWTMIFLSRKIEKLTGYRARSLINNKEITFSDIILPGDREHVWLTIQKAVKKNLPFKLEYRIKTANGRIKWLWEQGRQIVDDYGESFLEGVIMDIDDHKILKKQIGLMKDMVLAINASNDLHDLIKIIKTELSKIVLASRIDLLLFDWEKREFLIPFVEDEKEYYKRIPMTKSLDALVIKRNRSIFLSKLEIQKLERQGKIILNGPPPEVWLGVPLQIDGKSAGIITLQDFKNQFAINNADAELLDFVSVQVSASIQKKQAQDETHKLLQALEQSPVSVMITDLSGHIMYANNKAALILRQTVKELIGKTPEIIDPYTSNAGHYKEVWDTLKSEGSWKGEYKNTSKSGETCWEYAHISSIENSREKTIHYLYLKEEITGRKHIEGELLKAKNLAQESDKLKTAFLANISYQIRTPMNAIIGFTQMLRSDDYSKDDHEEFFDLIIDNSKKLLATIDNIIDIAKIEAGQLLISNTKCSANKILYDNYYIIDKLKAKLDREHVKVITKQNKIDENLVFYSDASRINQVLINLLENALKQTIQGSVEFGYSLLEQHEGKFIDFYVKDSGMGISEEEKELVFDQFIHTNDNYMGTASGSSLGLSISRNIARLMHGDIKIESSKDKGSAFHFLLPFNPVLPAGLIPELHQAAKDKKEMDWPDKTVLITEDEDSNFKLLEIMLRKTRVKIKRAFNGKQAVDYVIGGNDVDLILMDVRMPVMNGYEATEHIKKFSPSLPIIIQTAFALKGDRENSYGAGCDEYLSKPIKASELYGLLKTFLG